MVFSVMYEPERERLDALLRWVQIHQPLDQGALREPRHRVGFVSEAAGILQQSRCNLGPLSPLALAPTLPCPNESRAQRDIRVSRTTRILHNSWIRLQVTRRERMREALWDTDTRGTKTLSASIKKFKNGYPDFALDGDTFEIWGKKNKMSLMEEAYVRFFMNVYAVTIGWIKKSFIHEYSFHSCMMYCQIERRTAVLDSSVIRVLKALDIIYISKYIIIYNIMILK